MSLSPISGYDVISETSYSTIYSDPKKWTVDQDKKVGENRLIKIHANSPTILNRLEGIGKGILKLITFNLAFRNSSFNDLFAGRKWIYLNVVPDNKVTQAAKKIFTNSIPYADDIADQQYKFLSVNAPLVDPSTLNLKQVLLPDYGIIIRNPQDNNKLQLILRRGPFEINQGKSEFATIDFNPYVQTNLRHVKILSNLPQAPLPSFQLTLKFSEAQGIAAQLPIPVPNERNTGFYFYDDSSKQLYFQDYNSAYLVTDANKGAISQTWQVFPMLHASLENFKDAPQMNFKQAAARLEGLNPNQGFIYKNTQNELKIMYRDPQDPKNIKTIRFSPDELEKAKYDLKILLVELK